MESCNVVTATNGAQAVEEASLHQPDLIFMDIRMPIMDGYEATRRDRVNAAIIEGARDRNIRALQRPVGKRGARSGGH
jgi:CheY-like chemotaxis protein